MEFSIATHDDIDQLVEMRMLYLYEHFKEITETSKKSIEESLPRYFSHHLGENMIAFVARENNKIVSTAFLMIIEKPANPNFITGLIGEVLNVYTCKEHRRQGIAKHLMQMLLAYAKEHKLDFIELKATSDGYVLYKNLGFKKVTATNPSMKYIIESH